MDKTTILTGLITLSLLPGSTAIQAKDIKEKKAGTEVAADVKTDPTAGSSPMASSEAGIKPTVSDNPNASSFNGGFILSRVELKAGDDLSPYADKKGDGYTQKCKSLAGLVVFHIGGKGNKLAKGMYVWDGDRWQKVSYEL